MHQFNGPTRRQFLAGTAAGVLIGPALTQQTARAAPPPRPNPGLTLPKTPPTERIIALDISADLVERYDNGTDVWQAKEAYLASAVIQGLVNRARSVKVYLTHTPQEHTWAPYPADITQLADGLLPADVIEPDVDMSQQYPVLAYLLRRYAHLVINGMVRCPSLSPTMLNGAITAATTACAVTGSIPVTPAIERYVRLLGYHLPVRADTRGLTTNAAAYQWAKSRYFGATTRSYVGQHSFTVFGGNSWDQHPLFYDYFVATGAFVHSLDGNDPAQLALIQELLTDYPIGTPTLGLPTDEGKSLDAVQEAGGYFVITNTPNTSVTSSYRSDSHAITPPPPASPAPLRPNAAYVAFYVTDGDSVGFSTNFHYEMWRDSPAAGTIPVGWSFNPQLFDLYPTLFQWYAAHSYGGAYELVADFNDGSGQTRPPTGQAAYDHRLRAYLDAGNTTLTSVNLFYYDDQAIDRIAYDVSPALILDGYQGAQGGNAVTFRLAPGTTSVVTGLSGTSGGVAEVSELVAAVRYQVDATPAGQPAFVVAVAGAGDYRGGQDVATNVAAAAKALSDSDDRPYTFLRPRDLAATWKRYAGAS